MQVPFRSITQSILIAVRIFRIRPRGIFLRIAQSVPILIRACIIHRNHRPHRPLPNVRHAVPIGILPTRIPGGRIGQKEKAVEAGKTGIGKDRWGNEQTHRGKGMQSPARNRTACREVGKPGALQIVGHEVPTRINRGIGGGKSACGLRQIIESIGVAVRQHRVGTQSHALMEIAQSIPVTVGEIRVGSGDELLQFVHAIPVTVAAGIRHQGIKSMGGFPHVRQAVPIGIAAPRV